MKIITLLNEKGGCGKTTLATHLAAGLAIRGNRVVLADSDPQGHATIAMGLEKEPMLHDLLVRNLSFRSALRKIDPSVYSSALTPSQGELFVVPSDASARVIPLMTSDVLIVQKRFNELNETVDYVIFDTAPTPSLLHGAIYMATDYVLYPTKCEYLSFDGLAESLNRREQVRDMRQSQGKGEIQVAGIVPMMFRSSTEADKYALGMLKEQFGSAVWKPIPLRTVWTQASFAQRVLFNYAPEHEAAANAWNVVNKILEAA